MFYGQFGEDQYISNFFDTNYKGLCIDVGAYDGVIGSNTYYFEKNGWETLCIEPIPESFYKCNAVRNHTLNCCVSNYDKDDAEFNVVRLIGDNVSAISSLQIDERLIESHKDMINTIEKISVKVKSLNTIFEEENIPKNIDFISIDTENTEIDVLKGIDFNIYNVNFLIIENNFNESIIENYLKTQNFKKINRLAVNDFYVNNNYLNTFIFNCFKITTANYYDKEGELGNVTDIVNILLCRYLQCKNNNIVVCNNIFSDTLPFVSKKLFITIKNIQNNKEYKFIFNEDSILDFEHIFNELYKDISTNEISLSTGEIVDKYSILDLKMKYITDNTKLTNIKKEMNCLHNYVQNIVGTFFYKLLLFINEQIWIDTDIIKGLSINTDDMQEIKSFAEISHRIFENNQKRFRLKNCFNILNHSNIIECKSYSDNTCFIIINKELDIYDKIPEINFLAISYDVIYFNIKYKNIIKQIFKNPNIQFITQENDTPIHVCIDLTIYNIDNNIRDIFDFIPIKYKSGGKLGDYLNQLSVICENFYKTGQKGELYIYDLGVHDRFIFGVEHTYNDTYSSIYSQKYIKKYNIYNNESIDIDLSSWRQNLHNYLNYNWYNIYNTKYNVDWGNHKWLISSTDTKWIDKIIINITPYRFMYQNVIDILSEKIKDQLDNCVFISNETEHYDFFVSKTNLNIEFYCPKNFSETLTIINSCKTCFLGFSSMAVMANALHKPHYLIGINNSDFLLNNIKQNMSHVLDIFV
jgi:FkbM family methyltransferase